jgi:ferredoxin-NADP reductase
VQLVAEQPNATVLTGERLSVTQGTVLDALAHNTALVKGRDLYIAGPPGMLQGVARALSAWDVDNQRVHIDSFGL